MTDEGHERFVAWLRDVVKGELDRAEQADRTVQQAQRAARTHRDHAARLQTMLDDAESNPAGTLPPLLAPGMTSGSPGIYEQVRSQLAVDAPPPSAVPAPQQGPPSHVVPSSGDGPGAAENGASWPS